MRGATPSDEERGDRLETDGNAVGAADLDVRVVPLECLGEGPAELETILLRPKGGGNQGEIAGVRGPQFEKNSHYEGNGCEGICPEVVPRLAECHAVAKNTGSLADSGVANRTMIADHWRRRSWTTSWCMRPRAFRSPEVSDYRDTVAEGSDLPASEKRVEL